MRETIHYTLLSCLLASSSLVPAMASSHREAPLITMMPKVDASDFYLFRSYESGRSDRVILAANYLPLQDPYGGPNYFFLDPNAIYEIHIDTDGDNFENLTFRFDSEVTFNQISVPTPGGPTNEVALFNIGPFDQNDTGALNVIETYPVFVINHDTGSTQLLIDAHSGTNRFVKPVDNIGNKSITNYPAYAEAHIYDVTFPGGLEGRMFVGQRKDPFVVNLGETFDLVNLNPTGPVDGTRDSLADKNVTSLMLEVPAAFLNGSNDIVGAWTTAPVGGQQVSRLSGPLVNEVVIGLSDKDAFNASHPSGDAQFLTYVDDPTLPVLLNALFGVIAPTNSPRQDLRVSFLTGVPGLNATQFLDEFPFFQNPVPGSPNSKSVVLTLQSTASLPGPFADRSASVDNATRTLTVDGQGADGQFYRLAADMVLKIEDVSSGAGGTIDLRVSE